MYSKKLCLLDLLSSDGSDCETPNQIAKTISPLERVVPIDTCSIIYTPSFYMHGVASNKPNEVIAKLFLKADWITNELQDEIATCYPTEEECIVSSVDDSLKYCKEAYVTKHDKLFPVGRILRNFCQLQQTAEAFNNLGVFTR